MTNKKILLVDDDVRNSMFLKRFIEAESYEVTFAENGKVGWEKYLSIHPDLILLDVNMPEMNGFELAKKIRKVDNEIIIFFLTDRTEIDDRLKGFSLKGNDYIPKPFYPEELIAKMKERLVSADEKTEENYLIGMTKFDASLCSITCKGETRTLSARQSDLLQLLAEHFGSMVERETILNRIWGSDSYSNSLSLNVQITYLRKLLDLDSTLSIVSLKKKGYILKVCV